MLLNLNDNIFILYTWLKQCPKIWIITGFIASNA